MMTEQTWRPAPGYEGYYEVSDQGEVRSVDRIVSSGRGARRPARGRVLRQWVDAHGYQTSSLSRDARRTRVKLHVLVAAAFLGPRPVGMDVCHGDGQQKNNRLDNLRYGSRSENNLDSVRHGTHSRARRTHCPGGHVLEMPNLVPSDRSRGARNCLACKRSRASFQKHPEIDFVSRADENYAKIMEVDQ